MKFSIITCTLNSAEWVRESIDSISAQEGVEIERIFVDGGSTDGTLDILRSVKGDVKILEDVGGGISRAMNEGAWAASGDVIAHLHSDDCYTDSLVLKRVAEAFAANKDARWLYGRCMSIVKGKFVPNGFVTKLFSWHELIRANIVPHPSTFIYRDLFIESGGFSTGLKYTMDYDLWLRLAKVSAPIQLSDYLSAFRFHEGSLSTSNTWPCHNECLQVRMHYAAGGGVLEKAEHHLRHWVRSWRLFKALKFGDGVAMG